MNPPELPAARPPAVLNVANLLTALRLALVPVFVAALMADGGHDPDWRFVAFGIFALASITDRLDGDIARRRGLVTALGTIADPIADKALTGVALIALSVLGELPWWMTIVILIREWGITLLRLWVIRHGVIPASSGGKLKTVLQMAALMAFLVPLPDALDPALLWVMGAAVVVTVVTGVEYVFRAVALRRQGLAGEPAER